MNAIQLSRSSSFYFFPELFLSRIYSTIRNPASQPENNIPFPFIICTSTPIYKETKRAASHLGSFAREYPRKQMIHLVRRVRAAPAGGTISLVRTELASYPCSGWETPRGTAHNLRSGALGAAATDAARSCGAGQLRRICHRSAAGRPQNGAVVTDGVPRGVTVTRPLLSSPSQSFSELLSPCLLTEGFTDPVPPVAEVSSAHITSLNHFLLVT